MTVVTPPTITPEIVEFCKSIGCDSAPVYLPIKQVQGALPGRCHPNVQAMIDKHGGKAIYGWVVWGNKDWLETEFHSVYQTPTNELLDITPDPDGETRRLFVVDPNRVFEGYAPPKHYKVLSDKLNIIKAVSLFKKANVLRSGIKPDAHASVELSQRIRGLEMEAQMFLMGLK